MSETLQVFPSTIEDVYLQTWSRILNQKPAHVAIAKAVLIWVLKAYRSMTIDEVERAVATSPETHKFEPSRLVPRTTLVSLCCGVVTIDEESRLVRLVRKSWNNTLRLTLLNNLQTIRQRTPWKDSLRTHFPEHDRIPFLLLFA